MTSESNRGPKRGNRLLTKDEYFGAESERGPLWRRYMDVAATLKPEIIETLMGLPLSNSAFGSNDENKLLKEWVSRWGFDFRFAELVARNTHHRVRRFQELGLAYPAGFYGTSAGPKEHGDEAWRLPGEAAPRAIHVRFGLEIDSEPGGLEGIKRRNPLSHVEVTGDMATVGPPKVDLPSRDHRWNPTRETRNDARVRILKLVEADLDHALESIERAFLAAGYRAAIQPTTDQHLKWLAQRRILGLTTREIADQEANEDATVSDDVVRSRTNTAAERLGLKPQSDRQSEQIS